MNVGVAYIFTFSIFLSSMALGDKTPQITGVGLSTISHKDSGTIGINVWYQVNGYNILWRESTHDESSLKM